MPCSAQRAQGHWQAAAQQAAAAVLGRRRQAQPAQAPAAGELASSTTTNTVCSLLHCPIQAEECCKLLGALAACAFPLSQAPIVPLQPWWEYRRVYKPCRRLAKALESPPHRAKLAPWKTSSGGSACLRPLRGFCIAYFIEICSSSSSLGVRRLLSTRLTSRASPLQPGAMQDVVVCDLGGGSVKLGSARQPDNPKCAAGWRAVAAGSGTWCCVLAAAATGILPPALHPCSSPFTHAPRRVFPNASAKHKGERGTFLGEAMLGMTDVGGLALRRPIDRGYLVAWELQREIMARCVGALCCASGVATASGPCGRGRVATRDVPAALGSSTARLPTQPSLHRLPLPHARPCARPLPPPPPLPAR